MTAETQLHPHSGFADTAAEAFPRDDAGREHRALAEASADMATGPALPQEHVWWRTISPWSPSRRGVRMPWVADPPQRADRAASAESPGLEAAAEAVIARTPAPMHAHEFDIECLAVTAETPEIMSFTFRRRDGRPLGFRPGQYLNVVFPTDAGPRERNYSLSSSPTDPAAFRLSIKREDSGTVSRWAHHHVRPGTVLEALGPLGGFHLPDFDRRARYLLLAAGVGVTPLISMARTLHALDGSADVVVLHHASTPRDFAFARELRILDETDPRFTVRFSLGDRPSSDWRGLTGRISADTLGALVPDACGRMVFACGPPDYLARARAVLAELGVSPVSFFTETFADTTTAEGTGAVDATGTGDGRRAAEHTLRDSGTRPAGGALTRDAAPTAAPPQRDSADTRPWITFARTGTSAPVEDGDTLLSAGRRAGVPLRSNCASGMCGTCKVGLLSGPVEMEHAGGIRQREIDAGTILLCCSTPDGDVVVDA